MNPLDRLRATAPPMLDHIRKNKGVFLTAVLMIVFWVFYQLFLSSILHWSNPNGF